MVKFKTAIKNVCSRLPYKPVTSSKRDQVILSSCFHGTIQERLTFNQCAFALVIPQLMRIFGCIGNYHHGTLRNRSTNLKVDEWPVAAIAAARKIHSAPAFCNRIAQWRGKEHHLEKSKDRTSLENRRRISQHGKNSSNLSLMKNRNAETSEQDQQFVVHLQSHNKAVMPPAAAIASLFLSSNDKFHRAPTASCLVDLARFTRAWTPPATATSMLQFSPAAKFASAPAAHS
ncbi:unnamed protein product [Dovyalis caffra]|uniref:Uncharacterized protein n=1 Tax=Dovyalis caffra TaxID=77055 RepID=A0AAV1RJ31_9ROSI|nr:unnamed protein product [Dovyalis caffra]